MIEAALVEATNSVADDEPEIDEELVEEVQRHLSMTSRNTAINEVLRRFVDDQRTQRRTALKEFRELSDQGAFNYDALDEDDE